MWNWPDNYRLQVFMLCYWPSFIKKTQILIKYTKILSKRARVKGSQWVFAVHNEAWWNKDKRWFYNTVYGKQSIHKIVL